MEVFLQMKTLQTQWLMVMDEFGQLDVSDKYRLQIGLLGDAGEENFKRDWLSRYLDDEVVVIQDFWFEVFDQVHQIDFLIFNHGSIELVDIKNFEGRLHFEEEKFFVNNTEVLRNPLPKAREHVRYMKEWLYRKQLPDIPMNGNLVFINPHASLHDVPKTEISCLRPNDIRQYLRNIKPQPRTKQSVKILNALVANEFKSPYLPPVLDKMLVHPGWRCPVCQSHEYHAGDRHFTCICGNSFSKEKYAVEEICKYGVLYHHKDLLSMDLVRFFNGLFKKSYMTSCLRRNFEKTEKGYKNPRCLMEYYQINKEFRYKDRIVK